MEFSSPVKSNFLKVVSFGLGLYQFKRKTDHTQKKKKNRSLAIYWKELNIYVEHLLVKEKV